MSAMSNYLENRIIDHIFRGFAFAVIPRTYISLHSSDPTEAGLTSNEVGGSGYTRATQLSNAVNWLSSNSSASGESTGSSGQTSNNVAITFPTPNGDWGTVTHFGVWDAPTGGNMLLKGQLTLPRTINTADVVSFPVSTLVVNFS